MGVMSLRNNSARAAARLVASRAMSTEAVEVKALNWYVCRAHTHVCVCGGAAR